MSMRDFEKLGVFYLGRRYDADAKKLNGDLVPYDSKDLVTHALSVGMSGSGNTGLGLAATDAATERLERITAKPKKTNVSVKLVALVWTP